MVSYPLPILYSQLPAGQMHYAVSYLLVSGHLLSATLWPYAVSYLLGFLLQLPAGQIEFNYLIAICIQLPVGHLIIYQLSPHIQLPADPHLQLPADPHIQLPAEPHIQLPSYHPHSATRRPTPSATRDPHIQLPTDPIHSYSF